MSLRAFLDKVEHHFEKGGKYEKWYSLYEAADTILYRPRSVTKTTAHVRDGVDLKRIMITVWLCAFPAMFFGMWNVGYQANLIFADSPELLVAQDGWRMTLTAMLAGFDPGSVVVSQGLDVGEIVVTAGVQALHHCALLSRHQSRAQRSGDTECMLHLRGIEPNSLPAVAAPTKAPDVPCG